ncbi:MAG TPA: type II secretion system protein [Candidatus Ozemobacteraceae bacterium]|nr:type II secretion system protein [Candidatus Ozemobacteraceae bacterium]
MKSARCRKAMTLIEVLVTIAVLSLALGPLVQLLSSSNRMSNASVYEVMAVHYAAEINEQLQWLAQNNTIAMVKAATGRDLEDLLTDPLLQAQMENMTPGLGPYLAKFPGTEISLLLSPLHPNFTGRRLYVKRLDSTSATTLNTGVYWDVTVSLSWKLSQSDARDHMASFSTILRE